MFFWIGLDLSDEDGKIIFDYLKGALLGILFLSNGNGMVTEWSRGGPEVVAGNRTWRFACYMTLALGCLL